MPSHDYHDALPGFSPNQILHDHCTECEHRAKRYDLGILSLDVQNFHRAWIRAQALHRDGLLDLSDAETPMLKAMAAIHAQLLLTGMLHH